jgi:hypothetical protein
LLVLVELSQFFGYLLRHDAGATVMDCKGTKRKSRMRPNALVLSLLALLSISTAEAKDKKNDNGRPPCATLYSIIQEDKLGNVQQGTTQPKSLKWLDGDLKKKYPDVCYAQPNPSVKTVFYITVTPDTYHGTRVVTNRSTTTHDDPVSGTIRDDDGNTATMEGTVQTTTTSTSSTAVPYSFEYGKFMLTIETVGEDGKPVVRHRFEQDGLYRTFYGFGGGRGKHPQRALIEDAVKWVHEGGLENPFQGAK